LFASHTYVVVLRAQSVGGGTRIQRNASEVVATVHSITREMLTSLICATQPSSNAKTSGSEHTYARLGGKVLNQLTLTMNFWNGKKNHLTFSISLFGNNYKQTSNHATKNKPHKNSVILFPGNLK